MKNYISKIPLGNNKFAFHQAQEYRRLGEALTSQILDLWNPPVIFYHMRNGGHVAALRKHMGSKVFSHLDVSRFFYRISKNKIIKSLKKIGFSFSEANDAAAHSVVVVDDSYFLPYGFTQSPILASLCLFHSDAGKVLMRARRKFIVSVYVDDIVISVHEEDAGDDLRVFTEEVIKVFDGAGFPISAEKRQVAVEAINTFNVTLSHNFSEITKSRMEEFFYQVRISIDNEDSIRGISNYVHSINADQGKQIDEYIAGLRVT